ncbi:MAG: DUF1365 domain-containing protein [Pseudomonadota bacterium]
MTEPALVYEGVVAHARLKPVLHKFRYNVFSFFMDLDRFEETAADLRWFSLDRFNLFSFRQRDHGAAKGERLADHVRSLLDEAGTPCRGRIFMLAYPRMLGFVFNPLTIYYCHNEQGDLRAVLYEVRNTFGGRHCYLIPFEGGDTIRQTADKLFHVSPFMDMDLIYDFELTRPGKNLQVVVNTSDDEGPVLTASFAGKAHALSDAKLVSLFFGYPLMTMKVIAGIHWEAFRLLAKGLRLKKGAPDPLHEVTVVRAPAAVARAA